MNSREASLGHGIATISIDTERMWGYADLFDEAAFNASFGGAVAIHDRLLNLLCQAQIPATWAVVGGLSLSASGGQTDPEFSELPEKWTRHIPAGSEASARLWYAREFVLRLRDASYPQDVGLHGGLTHLPWHMDGNTREIVRRELVGGIDALRRIGIRPRSFVYPRDLEAWHDELPAAGIRCYRGRAPILSERFGYSRAGSCIRAVEELAALTPPPVRPIELMPGLWNIPASMPLYSMTRPRTRIVPLALRCKRVRLGLEAAARTGQIFHLCLHPENLAQSPEAFGVFESIVDEMQRWRTRGDIQTMSMSGNVDGMSRQQVEHQQFSRALTAASRRKIN